MLAFSGKKVRVQSEGTFRVQVKNANISGPIPVQNLITEYLKLCVELDHPISNVKYSVEAMLRTFGKISQSPIGEVFTAAESLEQIW